jgi:alpha-pyrone synthase
MLQQAYRHSFTRFTRSTSGQTQPRKVVATIESIATGTPEHIISQADAANVVANLPKLEQNRSRIDQIYRNTRIQTRHLALNLLSEEVIAFNQSAPLQDRMQLYKAYSVPLAQRVAQQALESAVTNLEQNEPVCLESLKASIGLLVFVSSTGFVAPGVDAELIKRLGLNRNIARVTVNFMGCAAAMNGLRVASDYVKANPTRKALVVCLELSSINAVFNDNINDVIIHSIFGDGCAAVIVGAQEQAQAMAHGKIIIRDHLSYLVENTEDGITLGIREDAITCKLSRQLPDYIEAGVGGVIETFLADHSLMKEDIDLWAIHPGGTRIVERSQKALGLRDDQVAVSWDVLRDYGNMLSASVLFVLERMLFNAETRPSAEPLTGIAFSFSPGVGIEGILFEKV